MHRLSKGVFTTLLGAISLAVFLCAGPLFAQAIKPRILIVFDTSGSMAWTFGGAETHGDGSYDDWTGGRYCCPGTGGSRIYAAKEAMGPMLYSPGAIEFALAKFTQWYSSSQAGGWLADWYDYNQTASAADRLRYNGAGTDFSDRRGWLAVGFGQQTGVLPDARDVNTENDRAEVVMWMDHHEYSSSSLENPDTSPWRGPWNDFTEQELRADGGTPLGEVIAASFTYLSSVMAADLDAECRPYSVIVLTDGQYSNGDPVPQVANLYTVLGVDTWVIGLAYSSSTLNNMAGAGGGHFDPENPGSAFTADSQESLTSILYQIVSESVLIEKCDFIDNDCDCTDDNGDNWDCGPEDTNVDENQAFFYCDRHGIFDGTVDDPAISFPGPGTWSLADYHNRQIYCNDPGENVCDGQDDNCDGQTDEIPSGGWNAALNPILGTNCGTDVGECDYGTWTCVGTGDTDGTFDGRMCLGSYDGMPELCDGLDNDCDGVDDNGVNTTDPLMGQPCGVSSTPPCSMGIWQCDTILGVPYCFGAVDPDPTEDAAALCNGIDEDCDGLTDEGFSQTCGGDPPNNYGECQEGTQVCNSSGGGWDTCVGSITPTPEVCDGFDNNCDGTTDEGFGTTTCGLGVCAHTIDNCDGGSTQTCNPFEGAGTEDCNGVDDDCDGLTDEGLYILCGGAPVGDPNEGVCQEGRQYCDSATATLTIPAWLPTCVGEITPQSEQCDLLDNDCDGYTDEDAVVPTDPLTSGVCQVGTGECDDGELRCVADGMGGASYQCCNTAITATCSTPQGPVGEDVDP